MDLSGSARDIDSKGSTVNRSLSSICAWAASYSCYSKAWVLRLDFKSFYFSHALVLTIGSTVGLLFATQEVNLSSSGQVVDHLVVGRGRGFHHMQSGSANDGVIGAQVLYN